MGTYKSRGWRLASNEASRTLLLNPLMFWRRAFSFVVGLILIVAGLAKPLNLRPLLIVLRIDGVPSDIVPVLAWALIVVEFILGYALIFGFCEKLALSLATGLFLAFGLQLCILIAKPDPELQCGCFGPFSLLLGKNALITEFLLDLTAATGLIWCRVSLRNQSSVTTESIEQGV